VKNANFLLKKRFPQIIILVPGSAAPVVLVRVARLYIAYQKFQFGYILEGLVIENVIEIEYITAIGYVLCTFGHFVVIWYIIPHFGILYQEKSGNPGSSRQSCA
jgi:hypothetical protein